MKKKTVKLMDWGIVYHYDCTVSEFFDLYDMDDEGKSHAKGYTLTENGVMPCVWVENNNLPALSHETLHAVFDIAKQMGIKYSKDSEEFYTYALDYFIKEALKKIK